MNWLYRIRFRLLAVNILAVVVPIAGISFARFYEREMLRSLEEDMIHQAQVLREVVLSDPRGVLLAERQPDLVRISRQTVSRIRLIDSTGATVADSHRGVDEAEAGTRSEVKRALSGRYGARLRANDDVAHVFSALPIVKDGEVHGAIYVSRSTVPVHAAMHRLRQSLARVLMIALACTAILTLFLAATISRPLARLTELARRIARGDRRARLRLDRRDEIGELARAFDAMERQLDRRATEMAELAANISHEFKTPLTSVRGAAELLLDGAVDDPEARTRFLTNILADADRLDRLVTRLLVLSRVQADEAPFEEVELAAVVAEVVAARHGDPTVSVENLPGADSRVRGRRPHLVSAIGNLVDNAREHAAPESTVRVAVYSDGDSVSIAVENDGREISEANMARIWDRFFTTRSGEGGTGLGLPIVRVVADAHGGSVNATSSAGTTRFELVLPRLSGQRLPVAGGDETGPVVRVSVPLAAE